MKRFADLYLTPDLTDEKKVEKMIRTAASLGYTLVGVSLPRNISVRAHVAHLERMCRNHGVDLATRIDLMPDSLKELLRLLRRYRRKFELVSVNCRSKSVARQAAKDHRVDLLSFGIRARERFFDNAEARLANEGVAALEITTASLLRTSGVSRAFLLSRLRKESEIAMRTGVPIVISSNAADPYEMRAPHDVASLATLLSMERTAALCTLSTTPFNIVDRNRLKLDESYIARGVRLVEKGKHAKGEKTIFSC